MQVHSGISRSKEIDNRPVLSQKRETAGLLADSILHDFNNLLTAIMVYSGLLASRMPNDPQFQPYLEEIMASAQRGSQLVAQLINLQREETTGPQTVNANDLLETTLLLVEDEELVRRSMDAALSMRGYKVLPAANADEALRISQHYAGAIELMVTDLSMPAISGTELAQEMHAARPEMKVLFVSGSDDPRMEELDVEREGFFKKPFTPAALVQKIEELLNKHSKE